MRSSEAPAIRVVRRIIRVILACVMSPGLFSAHGHVGIVTSVSATRVCVVLPASMLTLSGCGGTKSESDSAGQGDDAGPASTRTGKQPLPTSSTSEPVDQRPQTNLTPIESAAAGETSLAESLSGWSGEGPQPEGRAEILPPVVHRLQYRLEPLTEERLKQAGLCRYQAGPLELVTDLGDEIVQKLLPLAEKTVAACDARFGKLPAAADGAPFRMRGFVMRDRELFESAGLVPQRVPLSFHGQQIGASFWMNDQVWEYYLRHLMIHELTHVYMRHIPGEAADLPFWYLEGMAELIGTHSIGADGSIAFGVMPERRDRYIGWDRIAALERDIAARGVRSIADVVAFGPDDFADLESYAWCWALCRFLDSHPRYQERFHGIGRDLIHQRFREQMAQRFAADQPMLQSEWSLFAAGLDYGFDFERSVIEFRDGVAVGPTGSSSPVEVSTDRGWQSSGVAVEAGQVYQVSADGRFTLANEPRPWVSEANGISFRYVRGRPIGRLLGTIIEPGPSVPLVPLEFALGNAATFEAPATGTLYLRVNDAWSELADNRGVLTVTVSRP